MRWAWYRRNRRVLLQVAVRQYPRACWIVALHHHVIEYPKPAKALSERIGTALINGSWFIRRLQHLADHAVIMHGHRHIDWIGECGGLLIVSAPSPVMAPIDCRETYFYVHTYAVGSGCTAQAAGSRADQRAQSAGSRRSMSLMPPIFVDYIPTALGRRDLATGTSSRRARPAGRRADRPCSR